MDVESGNISLEEGEIIDIDYTPLERPTINPFTQTQINKTNTTSDIDSDWSSKSDTDSDANHSEAKKPKLKLKSNSSQLPKRKKYDIWSSHAQDEALAQTLVSCDVSRVDRSRDVETYDACDLRFKLKGKRRGYKRKNNQNKEISVNRKEDSDEDDIKGSERLLLDLVANENSEDDKLAKDLANKLYEEKADLMLKIVQIAGKKKAIDIYNETKRIEADGGMLIMNRTRRRTPGGVFLFLLKRDDDISNEQRNEIFAEEKCEIKKKKKEKQKAKMLAIKTNFKKKEQLPELLNRGDLILQSKESTLNDRNESESDDVVNNPPPSPVTDGKETSNDGMNEAEEVVTPVIQNPRNLNSYEDDFLEITNGADMDIF